MPSITVLDGTNTAQTVQTLPAVGRAAAAGSLPITLSTEDLANQAAVAGTVASAGSAIPSTGIMNMGSDGTNARPVLVDSSGNVITAQKTSTFNLADATPNTITMPLNSAGTPWRMSVFPQVYNGSTWDRLPGNTSGILTTTKTTEEIAVRAARAYIGSTGVQPVASGSFLNFVLANPAGSGKNIFITLRRYGLNLAGGSTPGEYAVTNNPTTVPTTSVTPTNRWPSGGATAMTFKYQVATTALAGGTAVAGGFMPTNGSMEDTTLMTVLLPGSSFGVSIGGSGGGLAAAARALGTIVWYEE